MTQFDFNQPALVCLLLDDVQRRWKISIDYYKMKLSDQQ